MFVHAAGSADFRKDFGAARAVSICKQILNIVRAHGQVAAERSRFACLSQRYLDDVGITAAERAAALGYEEQALDGWRVVASHL